MQDIEKAYMRLLNNEVKYRFVIDMATLKPVAKVSPATRGAGDRGWKGGQCQALGVASSSGRRWCTAVTYRRLSGTSLLSPLEGLEPPSSAPLGALT
jgi:hypothetical protein